MKTKLRTTYLVTVLFFLFVTVGSMILFYNMFSEEFIIANNKKIMNSVFEDAQGMDLSSLTKSDRKRLKEFSDKGGVIAIYDGEKIIYFSGDTPERKKNIKRRKFDEKIYEYTYTPKANVSEGRKAIRLKGKIDQNVKTYYLYCSVKLRTLENSIGLISRFMLVEMIIILILGIPFSFYMAQRTVKPIEKLGKLAKKMENNEPINFEEYDFPNNEIGNLAEQLKSMYLKISSNLNELNNYNYLLKTQNKELIEFDERRKKFIGAATHELKTPLAIISTQLEMMNMDNDEAMSEYYESIMEEIQKMQQQAMQAMQGINMEEYMKKIQIEAALTLNMSKTMIVPAALEYLGKLTSDAVSVKAAGVKSAALTSKCKLIATLADSLDKANASLEAALKKDDSKARIEAMNGVREIADKLELEVADDLWPMPKYSELLFVY